MTSMLERARGECQGRSGPGRAVKGPGSPAPERPRTAQPWRPSRRLECFRRVKTGGEWRARGQTSGEKPGPRAGTPPEAPRTPCLPPPLPREARRTRPRCSPSGNTPLGSAEPSHRPCRSCRAATGQDGTTRGTGGPPTRAGADGNAAMRRRFRGGRSGARGDGAAGAAGGAGLPRRGGDARGAAGAGAPGGAVRRGDRGAVGGAARVLRGRGRNAGRGDRGPRRAEPLRGVLRAAARAAGVPPPPPGAPRGAPRGAGAGTPRRQPHARVQRRGGPRPLPRPPGPRPGSRAPSEPGRPPPRRRSSCVD